MKRHFSDYSSIDMEENVFICYNKDEYFLCPQFMYEVRDVDRYELILVNTINGVEITINNPTWWCYANEIGNFYNQYGNEPEDDPWDE
jgi:hypothetical protein